MSKQQLNEMKKFMQVVTESGEFIDDKLRSGEIDTDDVDWDEELGEDTNNESKATQDVTAIIDTFFDGLLVLEKRAPYKSKKHPSTLGFRFDLRKGAYNEFREFTLALRRQKIKKADIANVLERQIREAGYTFYNPFPKRNPVKVQASHGGLGSDYPHVGFVLDFEGDSIYKRGSMDRDGNVQKVMKELDEGANDNWGVGDFVVAVWDKAGRHGEPLKVTGVYGDQVRVVDDYGNSELMLPKDLRLAPNEMDAHDEYMQGDKAAYRNREVDEGVGDWIKRLDKKAGDWATGKAENFAKKVNTGTAKRVAELVRDEGIKMTVIHIRYTTGGKGKLIQQALERYLEHSPDGEYAEEVRYVLPALDKDADVLRQAEINAFGAPLGEDENDARGKMCPVCTGGRREGYGNDCPNCGGEGYIAEDDPDDIDRVPDCNYCDDEEPLDGVACLNCGSLQYVDEDPAMHKQAKDTFRSANDANARGDSEEGSRLMAKGNKLAKTASRSGIGEDEADGMGHYDVAIEYFDKRYDDLINAEPEPLDRAIETATDYIEWIEKGMMNAEITSKRVEEGDQVRFKIYSLDKFDNSTSELLNIVVRPADPADYVEDDICLESVVDDLLGGNPLRKTIAEFNDQRGGETSTNLPKGFEVVDEEEEEFIDDDDDLDNLSINVELDD